MDVRFANVPSRLGGGPAARLRRMDVMNIAEALALARQLISAAEARLLLGHVLGRNSAWIEAHRDDALGETDARDFAALAARRAAGEPVAYLLGSREFYGRDFKVSPAVLIPRPDTELLVELALAALAGQPSPRVLDLGTGSGCIAITLALERPDARLTAVDAAAAALAVASQNAAAFQASVRCLEGEWFAPVGGERFDLIVSNPPYVAAGDRHLGEGDLRFEPLSALASGVDGLDDIRCIVAAAPAHLESGGCLLLEHGYDQAAAVVAMLSASGFRDVASHPDLAGIPRVTGGRLVR